MREPESAQQLKQSWNIDEYKPDHWRLTLANGKGTLVIYRDRKHPEGLMVDSFEGNSKEPLSRVDLFDLVDTIVHLLEMKRENIILSYPTNPSVSALMRKVGTQVLDFDEENAMTILDKPVAITTSQLREILKHRPKIVR
jgi:hypothetical protein